jgi:hypothetical protein
MNSNPIYLTPAAIIAIGAGTLGSAQDALSTGKKHDRISSTESHGEETPTGNNRNSIGPAPARA